MYSNVQSLKMYREGENIIWFIKILWKLLMPSVINCLDRFTSWFGTVLIYIMIWNGFDLHHDLEQFWFTSWFGTVLIHNTIWNHYDSQHYCSPYIRCSSTNVLRTCQTVYIDTTIIPGRYICYLSDRTSLLAF